MLQDNLAALVSQQNADLQSVFESSSHLAANTEVMQALRIAPQEAIAAKIPAELAQIG